MHKQEISAKFTCNIFCFNIKLNIALTNLLLSSGHLLKAGLEQILG